MTAATAPSVGGRGLTQIAEAEALGKADVRRELGRGARDRRSGRNTRESQAKHHRAIAPAMRLGLSTREIATAAGVTHGSRSLIESLAFEVDMVPLNVPNVLTVVRILLVPVLVVALLEKTGGGDLLAAIVFAAASLTDAIDGYLARSRNWVTTFGKLMDPIADKLLIVAALVALVSLGRLEAWVAMVIIAREFAVTVLRVAAGTQQGVVIAASSFGKLKTAVQVAMVMVLIAVHGRPVWVSLLVYATVLVTVLSGADYFFGLRRRLAERGLGAKADTSGSSGPTV